ncbi:MAG: hypothetical protein JWO05_2823 [Gemmatimonadetes bacterium]|nr:hypothetical protein [Gemmatimonadota bacterium]
MPHLGIRNALLTLIALTALVFALLWALSVRRARSTSGDGTLRPSALELGIGFVVAFFDTLGIGSFATTTTLLKTFGIVPDENLPGTILVGLSLPAAAQGLIFLTIVNADATLLMCVMVATVLGGWLGARVVTSLPRRPIQVGMGIGLLLAATFMTMSTLGVFPSGGTAIGLPTTRLVIASTGAFVFGGLLMIGIGNFAPCLILLTMLGLDPHAAFPVIMGASAVVAMVGSMTFIRKARYSPRPAIALTLAGIPAVLVAAFLVKSLPLLVLRWAVVGVVTYAAGMMLRSAARPGASPVVIVTPPVATET